jgi:excisionase family DNA binding protein
MDSKPFNVDSAAEYMGISKSYLYRLTSGKKISFYKPAARLIYFKKEDLDKWIERNRVKADYEIEDGGNIK